MRLRVFVQAWELAPPHTVPITAVPVSLAKGEASQILQSAQARANATARTLDTEARSYAFIDQHLNISKTDKSQLLA